jgi:NADPH-dependent ferric siderophore reductase
MTLMLTVTVQRRWRISPHFVSIILGGADFQHLEQSGYDQAGRHFFAGPGQGEVVLPSSPKWMLQYTLQPVSDHVAVGLVGRAGSPATH